MISRQLPKFLLLLQRVVLIAVLLFAAICLLLFLRGSGQVALALRRATDTACDRYQRSQHVQVTTEVLSNPQRTIYEARLTDAQLHSGCYGTAIAQADVAQQLRGLRGGDFVFTDSHGKHL